MPHEFRSDRHPGDVPAAILFGQALAVPVGVCALPVMIGALVTMLDGGRPLPFLLYGFPLSLVVAWWWTASTLRATVVEVWIDDGLASYRSRWDVAIRRPRRPGSAVIDVRRSGGDLLLTIGLDTISLVRAQWPDHTRIESIFRAARDGHVERVQRRLDPPTTST